MTALGLLVRSRAKVPERRDATGDDQLALPAPTPAPQTPSSTGAPREFLAAWVQFLRDDITEATNELHNRLNVISLLASLDDLNLTDEQRRELEQIRIEVSQAARVTASLQRRVTAMAPDTMPPIVHEYDGAALQPASILVVENDDANRSVIAKVFERFGHHVVAVTNGLDAFEQLQSQEIDCVICDLRLPFVGGRTIFEQVEERLPHLAGRFVFVTGDYTNPESRRFLEQSGQPVVGKPFELDTLLGAVAAVLRRRQAVPAQAASMSGRS